MTDIKIGFIGLGSRGANLLEEIVLGQGESVTAVCDSYADRAENGAELVTKAGQNRPHVYTDAEDVIRDEEVNTVIIASAWESHVEIAISAMYAGKAVAMEVGGAYTLNQCWDLVKAYEETKTPFMFLENCCFGRREMMVLNMVQQGLFGEIVHCAGGYHHDLRKEVTFGKENRHYRLRNYLTRNCENYPTHELGPIAKVLNINHGNRMLTLTSTASKASGLHDYILKNKSDDEFLKNQIFAQGDVVTTVIKCAKGETIVLTLDTTLPRYYTRNFTVRGTAGMYEEVTDSVFLDREEDIAHDFDWRKTNINNAQLYEEEYDHPVWKEYLAEGVQGTHDGMDWLEFKTFFRALRENAPMPIDVYDAVSWMAITVLSEMSIARGGAVVDIPDFTNGKWDSEILPRK
ncbi:MAG: Gfo/Idh/MocA family protein [Bariatricus sp.]